MFRDARSGAFELSEAEHFLRVVPDLNQPSGEDLGDFPRPHSRRS